MNFIMGKRLVPKLTPDNLFLNNDFLKYKKLWNSMNNP